MGLILGTKNLQKGNHILQTRQKQSCLAKCLHPKHFVLVPQTSSTLHNIRQLNLTGTNGEASLSCDLFTQGYLRHADAAKAIHQQSVSTTYMDVRKMQTKRPLIVHS